MNWEQFLKPNKKKILIFIALVILFILSMMIYFLSRPISETSCTTEECKIEREAMYARRNLNDTLFLLIASPFIAVAFLFTWTNLIYTNPEFYNALDIILFILSFFYWYILSCIIVWIYDKFRKKK